MYIEKRVFSRVSFVRSSNKFIKEGQSHCTHSSLSRDEPLLTETLASAPRRQCCKRARTFMNFNPITLVVLKRLAQVCNARKQKRTDLQFTLRNCLKLFSLGF